MDEFLNQICNKLSDDEFRKMSNECKDIIPPLTQSKLKGPRQLFQSLKALDKLTIQTLHDLLTRVDRFDLAVKLESVGRENPEELYVPMNPSIYKVRQGNPDEESLNKCQYDVPRSTSSQTVKIPDEPVVYDTIERPLPEIPGENLLPDRRTLTINEILKTEKSFLEDVCDMLMLKEALMNDSRVQSFGVNVEIMFGNMEQISEVANNLFRTMELNINQKPPGQKKVGRCFLDNYEEMEKVYSSYSCNYVEVEDTLKNYEENMLIRRVIENSINTVKDQLLFLDFKSLLIKPVQRIGKYTLFLENLIEVTDENHIDKNDLIRALGAMKEVMNNLNEDKRFFEIHEKVKQSSSKKNVAKSLSQKLKKTLKITSDGDDRKIDEEEKKLCEMIKVITGFLENLKKYLEKLQVTYVDLDTFAKSVSRFCGEQDHAESIKIYQNIWTHISEKSCQEFIMVVNKQVTEPLQLILKMISNMPRKFIQERSKLIAHESSVGKSKTAERSVNPGESDKDFLVLNRKLLQDLPILHKKTTEIYIVCLKRLVFLRRNFLESIPVDLQNLVGGNQTEEDEFMQVFEQAYAGVAEKIVSFDLSTSHKTVQPRTPSPPSSPGSPTSPWGKKTMRQTKNLRDGLTRTYEPTRLCTVKADFRPCSQEEICLYRGELVAVLKKQDASGNKNRWCVDKGGEKGYVPSAYLIAPEISENFPTFRAQWPFEAERPGELNLEAGDIVHLIESSDKYGNTEWYLVTKKDIATGRDCQGYVPSQYLTKMV